jgi:hypothetical protein
MTSVKFRIVASVFATRYVCMRVYECTYVCMHIYLYGCMCACVFD